MLKAKLDCSIQRNLTFRMKILLFPWCIMLIAPTIIIRILYIILVVFYIIYRKIIIKKIKMKTDVFVTSRKIILESPFFKKEIDFDDIKMIGYRKDYPKKVNSKTGDLIINLTPLKLDYLYMYNLILDNYSFAESKGYRSFIIPDLINVDEIYDYIIKEKRIKREDFKEEKEYGENTLLLHNKKIMIRNYISEIIYDDEKKFRLIRNKNKIKISEDFWSKNMIMKDYGLPSTKYK